MKSVFVKAMLMASVITSPVAMAYERSDDELCFTVYEASKLIMTKRQAGAPLPEVIRLFSTDLARGIVFLAYDQPPLSSPEMQDRLIREFANLNYQECIRTFSQF